MTVAVKPLESAYLDFDRVAWARLRDATPLTLGEADLAELRGINDRVSLAEVETIYLPVSRLLNLHVAATQRLHETSDTFLGRAPERRPYFIGVAGSVAVGKSTFARILGLLALRSSHAGLPRALGRTRASISSPPTGSCCRTRRSKRAASWRARDSPKATTSAGWWSS